MVHTEYNREPFQIRERYSDYILRVENFCTILLEINGS